MINPNLVLVKGGTFTMGSNDDYDYAKPVHPVTLSSFYIGQFTVTQKEWGDVMGSIPSEKKGDDLPVTNVSWEDVQEFIQKLNAQTGKQYRLPTEAEWEYAARGGNQSKRFKYAGSADLDEVAWFDYNTKGLNTVGQKKPNKLVIYDMSGNIWEWCEDWYGEYSSSAQVNPIGPVTGLYRVVRGGSWDGCPRECRITYRDYDSIDFQSGNTGFRLAHDSDTFNQPEKSNSNKEQTIKINYNFEEGKKRVKVALIDAFLHLVNEPSRNCEQLLHNIEYKEEELTTLDKQVKELVDITEVLQNGAKILSRLIHSVNKAESLRELLSPASDAFVNEFIKSPIIQDMITAAFFNVKIEEI